MVVIELIKSEVIWCIIWLMSNKMKMALSIVLPMIVFVAAFILSDTGTLDEKVALFKMPPWIISTRGTLNLAAGLSFSGLVTFFSGSVFVFAFKKSIKFKTTYFIIHFILMSIFLSWSPMLTIFYACFKGNCL